MTNKDFALLVVDDNEDNLDMLSTRLERQGYRVSVSTTGRQALAMLRDQAFDLVLLDVEMAEMDGLEVLSTIRESYSVVALPVIMVTARDQSGDVIAALQMGANDYVPKPINFPLALARIQNQLAIKQAQGAACLTEKPVLAPVPASLGLASAPLRPEQTTPPRPNALRANSDRGTSPALGDSKPSAPSRDQRSRDTVRLQRPPIPLQSPTPADLPAVRDYEILGELGQGGMGVVYKARHQRMNRMVALKVIDHEYLTHPDAVRRFYQEVQAAAQLHHPNIVLAYDAGQAGETHYLAMEYVEGLDLAQMLKRSGRLPVEQACDYIRQVALGLQHAHERGMVHRDIKPSNLMVTQTDRPGSTASGPGQRGAVTGACRWGVVKILDMGLALLHQPVDQPAASSPLTCEGRWVGTPDYLSPEQALKPHYVDIRSDLYSLGCTFYHLLAGQVPFPDETPMEKLLKHNLSEPTPVEQLRLEVPPQVAAIVRRLMAKRPQQRYATPREVAEALA